MGSVIRASVLTGYGALTTELGGHTANFLSEFNIPGDIVVSDTRLLPHVDVARLLEVSAQRLQCPDFALRLAARQGVDRLGGIAVIACNSASAREAVEAVARFMSLHSPAIQLRIEPVCNGPYERLVFDQLDPALSRFCQIHEQTLGNTLAMLRMLMGENAAPQRVLIPHAALAERSGYRDYFTCPVEFLSGYCAMEFLAEHLDARLTSADPVTKRLATNYLEQQLVSAAVSLSARVRELMRQLLPTGQYQVAVIAAHLSLHPRTLQRRLALEGLRFDTLLDWVRRELAAEYLSNTGLALGQITGLLGYAEQSTFQRACRRWFADTPRNYRRRLARIESVAQRGAVRAGQ
ncbi:AraC family transcriptional regulator ligand-binding domain-containing protein [Microbulbifer echini]|uniref:AraC family transcriptional regulator ligand-binding domain-containing protein n=1 Tax=Microbulbifer echini TaxID=1529067 RepID=A0ABV4NN97_9GAMM|nr:AraC family transcriptional regulator [uncultured Microbulbifer sp.]